MKKFFLLLLTLNLSLLAADKFGFSVGKDFNENFAYEVSYKKQTPFNFLGTEHIYSGVSGKYLDNEDLKIFAVDPLIFSFELFEDINVDLSVGLSYFSEKRISDKDFGIHFQFKDTIAFVYEYSRDLELELNYTHYSNAYLHEHNSGLDILSLKLNYLFNH